MPDMGFFENPRPGPKKQLVDDKGVMEAISHPDPAQGAEAIHKAMGGGEPDEKLKKELAVEVAKKDPFNIKPGDHEE